MSLLSALRRLLAAWFARAVPVQSGRPAPVLVPARRRTIHDVVHEQRGVAHWSSHTHF